MVKFLVTLFTPVTFLIMKLSNLVVRIFGVDPHKQEDDVTEEEIISMVDDAHEQGVIEESEAEMIQNIMEFSETEAQDIMTHRKNINAIEETMLLKDALLYMLENSNSRYPVYREDIDNIVGILHLKDAMKQVTLGHYEISPSAVFPIWCGKLFIFPKPEILMICSNVCRREKMHMVVVVDEYGQTSGIVTMEDILEEIVGNILDEYDEEEHFIQVQTDDSLIMEGRTPLEQVDEVLESDFDEEEFDTLNGYLTSLLGHVPNMAEDKEIRTNGYLFTILGVENNTIQKVRVEKLPEREKRRREMSGHSKFANIKHKKEKNDAKKGKIFTVIGREIVVAVKEGGPDPANNSKLRDVIAKAKANNMPNDTIERGIKKAAGDSNADNFEVLTYEGYGPSGVAIIVQTLTDNKNRTAGNVRSAFTKGNGNIGTPGSVSFMFDKKGQIIIDKEECEMEADDLMMIALDAGAEDFAEEEDSFEVLTDPDEFSAVREALEKEGIPTDGSPDCHDSSELCDLV